MGLNHHVSQGTSTSGSSDPVVLAATTSSVGQIQQPGGTRLLHTYTAGGGTGNLFLGNTAGNFTLSSATGHNTGVGYSALVAATSASDNTIFGYNAGSLLTTGASNVLIGSGAGATAGADVALTGAVAIGAGAGAKLVGNYSIAIGYSALPATTAGADSNIAIGKNTLLSATTCTNNIGIGVSSLASLTAGSYNVAIGDTTGYTGTHAQSIYIGFQAGQGGAAANTTGNVAIGHQTMYGLTSGGSNVAVGRQAGQPLTTGSNNTMIGNTAGNTCAAALTGAVAIGAGAGLKLVGDYSVAIGYQALDATTAGAAYNTAIGKDALGALTTGTQNVAIGDSAAAILTTGGDNTYLGYSAGSLNAGACARNVCLGSGAGQTLGAPTTDSVVIGYNAAQSCQNYSVAIGSSAKCYSQEAVAIGYAAGMNNQCDGFTAVGRGALAGTNTTNTSAYSIAIGWKALDALTAGAARNVAIGKDGLGALTTGTDNTSLGDIAGSLLTTGSSNVVIGSGACATSGTAVALTGAVVIGKGAGAKLIGDYSIAIGYGALPATTAGAANNIAIGKSALAGLTTATGCVAIGTQAGDTLTTLANELFIANATGTPLIGGNFSSKQVRLLTTSAAPADADLANGQICFWLDEAGNNLKCKAKYSGGTVKSATIALV